MRRVLVWAVVAVAVVAVSFALLRPVIDRTVFVLRLATDDPPPHLTIPVALAGKQRLVNTWNAPRDGGRRHQGIDIFAPRGTAVLSTTRGLVTRVGTNRLGGNVVWVLGPGLEAHYYAHLDRFAGIQAGDMVEAGDVLGYVGRTGNAQTTPFHLHYGIYRRGTAENPFPRLVN